jgi:hypothetical protein
MRDVSDLIDDSWRIGWVEVIAVSANSIPEWARLGQEIGYSSKDRKG